MLVGHKLSWRRPRGRYVQKREDVKISQTGRAGHNTPSAGRESSGIGAQHVDGEVSLGELEVPLVVELEQGGAVRVELLQVQVVHLGLVGGVAALLADVHLGAALLVRVLVLDAVNLERVRLERAPLREGLVAHGALVGADASVRPCVALEVERVVEALAAEGAQVALEIAVTLEVPVEEPLQRERLAALLADQSGEKNTEGSR